MELLPPGGSGLISLDSQRMEMDLRVATARKFPRPSDGMLIDKMTQRATRSEDVAESCAYALKRDGKIITGPSVRLAEIVFSAYHNIFIKTEIAEVGDEFVIATATCWDLENNTAQQSDVSRRIVKADGNRYGVDMIGTTSLAAMSIAKRNAIFAVVPRDIWGVAYDKAFSMIKGTFESIEKRRTHALDAYRKMGVDQALVLALLEKDRIGDIEPEDMVVLRGTLQAIKDGDTTVNAVFGNVASGKGAKADVGGHLDKGKANGTKTAETKSSGKASPGAKPEGGGAADRAPAGGDGDGGSGRTVSAGDEGRGDANSGSGPADGQNDDAAEAGSGSRGEGDRSADLLEREDGAGGRGTGDEGGSGGGASANASGPSEDATALPIGEDLLPFLKGFEGPDLAKLVNLARALTAATTPVQVAGAIAEFTPVFESASDAVTASFNKMGALANKNARKKTGASRL